MSHYLHCWWKFISYQWFFFVIIIFLFCGEWHVWHLGLQTNQTDSFTSWLRQSLVWTWVEIEPTNSSYRTRVKHKETQLISSRVGSNIHTHTHIFNLIVKLYICILIFLLYIKKKWLFYSFLKNKIIIIFYFLNFE